MRGPADSPMASPMALLDAVTDPADFATLDALVRISALEALVARGARGHTVFLNVEPRGLGAALSDELADCYQSAIARARGLGIDAVVEITERALLHDPATLLRFAEDLRSAGIGLALDDVGATPESLAFLPLLRPDVVKLDLRLVREHGSVEIAQLANAVHAYSEDTGASVVAEGIETERDHQVAVSLGATLGQGWLYGYPAEAPDVLGTIGLARRTAATVFEGDSPYDIVSRHRVPRRADKRLLLPLSESLEVAARGLDLPPVLFGCFQDARQFSAHTAMRYTHLAQRLPMVVAMGRHMPAAPAPGVRGANLAADDELIGEWTVIVLGAHYAAALAARDLGDVCRQRDRRFDYVVTHDRALVIAAAQTLVHRLAPVVTVPGPRWSASHEASALMVR